MRLSMGGQIKRCRQFSPALQIGVGGLALLSAVIVALYVGHPRVTGTVGVRTRASAEPVGRTQAAKVPVRQTRTSNAHIDKWSLWTEGTRLRGANIYQRRVYSELDGPDFMGHGAVGPPCA